MIERGGLSLSIIIWRIGGGEPSFLFFCGPKILLAALVSRYLSGTLGDSHYFLLRMSFDMNHFLFECKTLDDIRQELFEEIETVIKSFYPDLAFSELPPFQRLQFLI